MKNINTFFLVVLIAALAVFSCGGGDEGEKTLGTIEILKGGNPVGPSNPANTGDTLYASYSGNEDVSYQWKFGAVNVGEDRDSFSPEDPGSYTVTVRAPGYQSRTSKAVTVGGASLPALPGTLAITVNGAAVTTAQTGDELVAVYSGDTPVEYQWFKDGKGLTTYSDPDDTAYTPAESGSYAVKITAIGYRATTSDPVAVTGAALITITFDLNGAGYDHPEKLAAPGAAIGTLPNAPPRNGFSFVGWYTEQSGGTALTEATTFDEATTVFARWSFSGGIPHIDAETNTLVHENPLMEKGTGFAGSISDEDGTISYTAGGFQYKFPTIVDGVNVNISDYAYFIVRFELKSASGSVSGVLLKQYGNDTDYGGKTGNDRYPWLSNEGSSGIRFMVSGAGSTGGFSMRYNGGTGNTIEVRITSITFYKLPSYTVTFALDGGEGTAPADVTLYQGETLGAQFPATPTKTDYTFTGWKNAEGTVVTATTPIMGDWTLTAQWMLTSEVPAPIDVVTDNGTLFTASGGSTATKFTYDGKQWWVFARTPVGSPAAVAPFDGDAAEVYTAALAAGGAYARVSYSLSALSSMWQSFPKVTITYDLIVVGGNELTLTVRNGVGAGGEPNVVENQAVVAGTGQTLTFNTSAIGSGNLAFVKRNNENGVATLFLLRITKVELLM